MNPAGSSALSLESRRRIFITACSVSIFAPASVASVTNASRTSMALFETGNILPVSSTLVSTPSDSIFRITSSGESAAKADRRNLPCRRPNASAMPRASQLWVMLQRVPPDIKILTPIFVFFSRTKTRRPRTPALAAAINPAAPAPTTITFHLSSVKFKAWFLPASVWICRCRQL